MGRRKTDESLKVREQRKGEEKGEKKKNGGEG